MISPVANTTIESTATPEARLRETARDLEQAFVQEMLKHAGLTEAFAGEGGEVTDAFSGFLLEAIAEDVTAQGGFGLAEQFYQRLKISEEPGTPVRL